MYCIMYIIYVMYIRRLHRIEKKIDLEIVKIVFFSDTIYFL